MKFNEVNRAPLECRVAPDAAGTERGFRLRKVHWLWGTHFFRGTSAPSDSFRCGTGVREQWGDRESSPAESSSANRPGTCLRLAAEALAHSGAHCKGAVRVDLGTDIAKPQNPHSEGGLRQVLQRLIEIERAIGLVDALSLRRMIIEAEDHVLEMEKALLKSLRLKEGGPANKAA